MTASNPLGSTPSHPSAEGPLPLDRIPEDRAACLALDKADPLAPRTAAFHRPDGVIYLDGNSLGMRPQAARDAVLRALDEEWADGLIRSWNQAGWIDQPRRLGDRIGGMIGAGPGQTIVADSTSINLFKVLVAALRLNPDRSVVLSEAGNFPSDLYVAQGVGSLMDRVTLKLIPEGERDPIAHIDESVAVVMLTHVDFKTAHKHDMARVTAAAHAAGALVIWDLAHSAGALPVDLDGAKADFAVGCTYKYLNAGPGGPAFVYVADRHQATARQPLTGWLGHARPFAFTTGYEPAPGIEHFVCGTPPILAFAALDGALDLFDGVAMDDIRAKSQAMIDLFLGLVDRRLGAHGFTHVTPRDAAIRGSHASLTHPEGYAIMQALIDQGVIGDFRAPDILRFGFTPLTLRYAEVWDAVDSLARIMDDGLWRAPQYQVRGKVT